MHPRQQLPLLLATALALFAAPALAAPTKAAQVDHIFARWNAHTPGCVVGVAEQGKPVLTRAYGMADLEHGARNAADTVFEAGSVSKQFTAAAVALLARDGKLSLDDQARKYLPELPDYGMPLTIRQMLNHTSGLRDWGSVSEISGWPRTTRAYTHANVLDITSRQTALNFTPGTRWSYSNEGYNLAAIIVERVSGMPFGEFSRKRIFEPLGMKHTAWRDDFTRIVPNRAIAYDKKPDGFHSLMPFENVVGQGGLLTTVGDLLKWNENFVHPVVGDAAMVAQAEKPGVFNDGRPHHYGLGLNIGSLRGVPMVQHIGATAAYRAALYRFPQQHLSLALLCNAANADPEQAATAVAEIYLAGQLAPPAAPPKAGYTLGDADFAALAGMYRDSATGLPMTLERDHANLHVQWGPTLYAQSAQRLVADDGQVITVGADGTLHSVDAEGSATDYQRAPQVHPDPAQLRELAGIYISADAEATYQVAVDGAQLIVKRRPGVVQKLDPVYRDAFWHGNDLVIFRRDAAGKVVALSVVHDRVWDMRFERQM